MLAQNFKTADELGLAQIEFDAIVTVLGMLERGEIVESKFDMEHVMNDCGTPSCICGWANHVSKGKAFPTKQFLGMRGARWRTPDWDRMPKPLQELFAYDADDEEVYASTPEQAAIAVRSYLTTGAANWEEALGLSD